MVKVYSDVSLVVVTYKRIEMLTSLISGIAENSVHPGYVYIVDNDRDPQVQELCLNMAPLLEGTDIIWIPMESNTGGSGGFSKGVQTAYEAGAEWIWVMDDDVMLLPNALEQMRPWMDEAIEKDHRVIQCGRLDSDDTAFYWQYHFLHRLGILNPLAPSRLEKGSAYRKINTVCFEGGLFHRSIVGAIGAPDHRFFIYWDDAIYGYLASKLTQPILIEDILMKRQRLIVNMRIGRIRKLSNTSDMVRYYIMRNRGYMARYLMLLGEYNGLLWGLGTVLTWMKEGIRLLISEDTKAGLAQLRRGMKDARTILRDANWEPMPRLDGQS